MDRREFLRYSIFSMASAVPFGSLLTSCDIGDVSDIEGLNVEAARRGRRGNRGNNNNAGNVVTQKLPLNIPQDNGLLGYFRPEGRFTIEASPDELEIIPGKTTRNLLTYKVGNYINPIIVLRKGDTYSSNFLNNTGEKSIVHWHGFRADWESDGHPYYSVENGNTYVYPDINIIDRSGTYFYHPHPHGRTGYQVYHGLAGMVIIEDEEEDRLKNLLDLEYGFTDLPLIIQDKTFSPNGDLIYNPIGMNGTMGFWGDTVLVNLTPNPYLNVSRRVYRFRILNGSNARPYRLVLLKGSDKMRFWVIGVEGGLLKQPVEVEEILVSPGERIDILVDFRDANNGDTLKLYNLPNNLNRMGGMNRSRMNASFEVLEFRISSDSSYDKQIPSVLSTIKPIRTIGAKRERVVLGMRRGVFTINGQVWDESDPLKDYGFNYNNGDIVIFDIFNRTGMYHPMHIHGFQFQVLRRLRSPKVIRNLAIDRFGRMATDLGWKDTVIVAPRERVRIAVDMSHNFGKEQIYLFHCHILEHHDAGMMVNYIVSA